jgi:hypothetical protein
MAFYTKPTLLLPLLLATLPVHAEIIGYDSFDYRGSTIAGADGGVFWDFQNVAGTKHGIGVSQWANAPGFASVSVPGPGSLYTADSGMIRKYGGPSGTEEGAGAVYGGATAKKVYLRVSMQRNAAATWCGVSSFDFGTERLFFGLFPDGTGKFTIYDQNTFTRLALSAQTVNANQNYTLVAKIDYANNAVALYVDPNLNNAEAFNTPVAIAPYTAGYWSTGLRLGSGGSGIAVWDDLTVATTWENLRTYEVTSLADGGEGSLTSAISTALTTGGRIQFAPQFGSVFAVTDANRLLRFRRETPSVIEADVPIALPAGQWISGIEFHPDGRLFALISTGPNKLKRGGNYANRLQLHTVNLATGALTPVGAVGGFANMVVPSFDFDPKTLSFRLVDFDGRTGSVTQFGAYTEGARLDNLRLSDYFISIAHRGENLGLPSASSTLYHLAQAGLRLATVTGPAKNQLSDTGPLSHLLSAPDGKYFDIADDDTGLLVGQNGLPVGSPATKLFSVDLRTRQTVDLGKIGTGSSPIIALCAAPSTVISRFRHYFTGGQSVILDGHATAPGITLKGMAGDMVIGLYDNATVGLRNLNITQGRSADGGGISHSDALSSAHVGFLSLDRCSLFKNDGYLRGGGLYVMHGGMRMRQCVMEGNSSGTGAGLFLQGPPMPSRSMRLDHCSVIRNTSDNDGGGLFAIYGTTTVTNCIFAGNRSVGSPTRPGSSPDIHLVVTSGAVVPVISFARCLLSDAEGSGLFDGSNGNRIFFQTEKKLTALGAYGGPIRTVVPLAASPAIGMAVGSGINSDARGNLIASQPDTGAAEFQGKPDLRRCWSDDWDGDGIPYGVEWMTQTDPHAPNALDFTIKQITPSGVGTHALHCGPLEPAFFAYGRALFTSDPLTLTGTTTIGSISSLSPVLTAGSAGHAIENRGGGRFGVRFNPTPGAKRFYRLEAELLP